MCCTDALIESVGNQSWEVRVRDLDEASSARIDGLIRRKASMRRTRIGLCLLALGGCEAAQTPNAIEPSIRESQPVERVDESVTRPVVVAEPVKEVAKPELGTLKMKKLTAKAGPKRDDALLQAQCRVVNKECDLATVKLMLDGEPLDLRVPGATEQAPYGDWASLRTHRSDDDVLTLSMKFASHYQHLGLVLRGGVFEVQNSTRWPVEIRGELVSASDWEAGAIRYRCDAFAMGNEPIDCENLEVFVGDEQLFREAGIVSGKIDAQVLPAGAKKALRISTVHIDGEWEPVSTKVFATVDGKTVPVWDSMSNGKHRYAKDGSWEVTESECRKPAELDYDDKLGEEIVRKYGKEAFTKKRFVWTGTQVQSKVVKRWTDRRSACQTEGRCPHVYAGDESVLLGEVLRNRVGKAAWANEFVEVPRELVRDGTLKIRLAEEKANERTFVDRVWLVVNGMRIEPEACASPLCELDGKTLSMRTGDAVQLRFKNIPEAGVVRFFASGYYVYEQ